MERKLVASCPRCNERLIATKLNCDNCDLELNGDFPLSKFDYLTNDEHDFIECFLKYQGNFKAVQNEKSMSYPAAKKRLVDILEKLNLNYSNIVERNGFDLVKTKNMPVLETDSPVVKTIKEKLNTSGGQAMVTLYSGDSCEIRFDENGKGLVSPKIPPTNQLIWEAFDAAVEVVIKNGGKAKKGNAQSGAKLGTDKLRMDSVEGYIAHKVHGAKEGDTAFGPGFVICAILDWAEVCNNERGYLVINPTFAMEFNEILRNTICL